MPSSRQDQLHSYQYSQQRVVSALVTHDPDPSRSPLRRAGSAALISMLVAAIAVGGVAVYGLFSGSKKVNAQDEQKVFIEKESGAQYIYYKEDNRLHPVLNFTSGLLIAGGAGKAEISSVPRKSLAGVKLGEPMGITGAPDSLPATKDLLTDPWTICTLQPDVAGGSKTEPRSQLMVGGKVTDGRDVTSRPGEKPEALLVSDPGGGIYLIYGNRRFLIPREKVQPTIIGIGWGDYEPVLVASAWINAVPAGGDLVPPKVYGFGNASTVPGVKVGNMFSASKSDGSGTLYAMAMDDGVSDLTEMQAKLFLSDPETTRLVGTTINLSAAEFTTLPRSRTTLIDAATVGGQPTSEPALLSVTRRVCLTIASGAGGAAEVRIDPTIPAGTEVGGKSSAAGGARVDSISVARGRGVLVEATASPTAPAGSGTVSLVLDTGTRYPVANADVPAKLGYAGVKPLQFPAELVALLPVGPSLDPEEARKTRPQAG